MRHRGRLAAAVVAAGVLLAGIVDAGFSSAAYAANPSEAECSFGGEFTVSPGVSPTKARSDFVSETMELTCHGELFGVEIDSTRKGTYKEWGYTVGDCTSGTGRGAYTAVIYTVNGARNVLSSTYDLWYDGTTGTGGERGPTLEATFTFYPTVGSCTAGDPMEGFHLDQHQITYTPPRW